MRPFRLKKFSPFSPLLSFAFPPSLFLSSLSLLSYLSQERVRAKARVRLHDVVAGAEREDPGDERASSAAIGSVGLFRGDDGPEAGELGEDLFCLFFVVRFWS